MRVITAVLRQWDVARVQPAIDRAHDAGQEININQGFSRQEACLLGIFRMTREAAEIPQHGEPQKNPTRWWDP